MRCMAVATPSETQLQYKWFKNKCPIPNETSYELKRYGTTHLNVTMHTSHMYILRTCMHIIIVHILYMYCTCVHIGLNPT